MTGLTLLELIEALEISSVSEMDAQQFRTAAEEPLDKDALFCALLRNEGLGACQQKILRWAKDIYGAQSR